LHIVVLSILFIGVLLSAQWTQARSWAGGAPTVAQQVGNPPNGEQLTEGSDCASCHAVDRTVVGPAYREIARKYAGQQPDIAEQLARRVREGGSGNWGDIAMPPHSDLADARLQAIVQWILSLNDTTRPRAGSTDVKRYDYRLQDGKMITLDFPLFVEGGDQKVTKDVFRGYTLYNSYCYRCHGTDATESQLAPNLRQSMDSGMTTQQFLAVAMPGRDDKGMPGWAGFLSEEEMTSIYRYVKGRSLQLVPVGRPLSEFD
jgi:cytochrome c